jgi:nucleotide-binding universal stress UspA family protein
VKVIVCTDGSDDAVEAARRAVALLGAPASITVVCAVEPPAAATYGMESGFSGGMATPAEVDDAWAEVRAEAAEALDRTVAAMGTDAPVERRIELGRPGDAICRLAEEVGADVIVIGSRGRGALKRALLGSVSTHVAHNAPCPVVLVRAGTHR